MSALKEKATDLVVTSLNFSVTIATVFFGALLAYSATLSAPTLTWAYYGGLVAFAICVVFCILNIHSLINKLHRGDEDAIMKAEAKMLNVIAALSLLTGLVLTGIFISHNSASSKPVSGSDPKVAIVSDSQVVIGADIKSQIHITKENGQIKDITVGP